MAKYTDKGISKKKNEEHSALYNKHIQQHSVEELHHNTRGKNIVHQAVLRVEENFLREHTFEPKLKPSTVRIFFHNVSFERIF